MLLRVMMRLLNSEKSFTLFNTCGVAGKVQVFTDSMAK
jgi:hypothetical protein